MMPETMIPECPDSDVCIILRHGRLPTSESKDTGNLLIEWGFGSEIRTTSWPPQ